MKKSSSAPSLSCYTQSKEEPVVAVKQRSFDKKKNSHFLPKGNGYIQRRNIIHTANAIPPYHHTDPQLLSDVSSAIVHYVPLTRSVSCGWEYVVGQQDDEQSLVSCMMSAPDLHSLHPFEEEEENPSSTLHLQRINIYNRSNNNRGERRKKSGRESDQLDTENE